MTASILLNDPADRVLTDALTRESSARASNLNSGTVRNVLFGAAAFTTAAGVAIAVIILAARYDPSRPVEPIKVRLDLDGQRLQLAENQQVYGTLALQEGGVVSLKDGSTIGIRDGSVVTASGTVQVLGSMPMPAIGNQPTETAEGDAIKREVTVFSEVNFRKGNVVTGWNFKDGASDKPYGQYCYYSEGTDPTTQVRTNLAYDRKPIGTKLPFAAEAVKSCIWFGGDV